MRKYFVRHAPVLHEKAAIPACFLGYGLLWAEVG